MNVEKAAFISKCQKFRWWLSRRWASGDKVLWVMLNPSTADHEVDDPTIRRIIHFSRSWGYAGLTVVNLFPFRSSSPTECKEWFYSQTPEVQKGFEENREVIKKMMTQHDRILAAWGNLFPSIQAKNLIQWVFGQTSTPIFCLGQTQSGNPIHPMARGEHRVPDDAKPVIFQVGKCR